MIQESKNGGLEMTDYENDTKQIDEMLNECRSKLSLMTSEQSLRLSRIAISISIAAILLQLIQILL